VGLAGGAAQHGHEGGQGRSVLEPCCSCPVFDDFLRVRGRGRHRGSASSRVIQMVQVSAATARYDPEAMRSRRRGHLLFVPFALSLAGLSCGGGTSPAAPTPSSAPSPTVPQPIVVDQAAGTICWGCSRYRSITTTRAGEIRVELNWTYATNWLTVSIAGSPCDYSQECSWLAVSSWPQTAVASRTLVLANAVAGTYVVVVHSIGPGEESYSYQVTLTPTT
jgi:hypothetical protein